MKLCIPAAETRGLQSQIEPHFPHAISLQVFDTETRKHAEIVVGQTAPESDDTHPIDAILCGSINGRTFRQFQAQGIQLFGTTAATVEEAIAQFERGELQAVEASAGCGSHHGEGPEHQCCGGGYAHGHSHGGEDHECCGGGGGHHGHDHGHQSAGGGGGGCGGHGKTAGSGCGCRGEA